MRYTSIVVGVNVPSLCRKNPKQEDKEQLSGATVHRCVMRDVTQARRVASDRGAFINNFSSSTSGLVSDQQHKTNAKGSARRPTRRPRTNTQKWTGRSSSLHRYHPCLHLPKPPTSYFERSRLTPLCQILPPTQTLLWNTRFTQASSIHLILGQYS